jgi:hypothetical protein
MHLDQSDGLRGKVTLNRYVMKKIGIDDQINHSQNQIIGWDLSV